jgi:hypothetical protein
MNVKSPKNISKWHMGFNSAFKGLIQELQCDFPKILLLSILWVLFITVAHALRENALGK